MPTASHFVHGRPGMLIPDSHTTIRPKKQLEETPVLLPACPGPQIRGWSPRSVAWWVRLAKPGESMGHRKWHVPYTRRPPHNINHDRHSNWGMIGDDRDPASNSYGCQVCCNNDYPNGDDRDPASNSYGCQVCCNNDYPNATFMSGTQAIGYSWAIFLDLGSTADAIFAAKTAKEVIHISGVFPTLSEQYMRNEERAQ